MKCEICGRTLTNPVYMAMGVGPTCLRKAGITPGAWRHGDVQHILDHQDQSRTICGREFFARPEGTKPCPVCARIEKKLEAQVQDLGSAKDVFFP